MSMKTDATIALLPALTVAEARRARAQAAQGAHWLRAVWADDLGLPAFTWEALSSVPGWALGTPAELERLALLAGALFAAPALRVCLDAGPLLRVRDLIGAAALDRVLAVPGLPSQAPVWPADERGERDTLYAWGAALLVASVADPRLQASVARVLSFPADQAPPLPTSVAERMVNLAHHILETPHVEHSVPQQVAA